MRECPNCNKDNIWEFGNEYDLQKVEMNIPIAEKFIDEYQNKILDFEAKWGNETESPIVYKKRFLSKDEDTYIGTMKIEKIEAMNVEHEFLELKRYKKTIEKYKNELNQWHFIINMWDKEYYKGMEFCGDCGYIGTE